LIISGDWRVLSFAVVVEDRPGRKPNRFTTVRGKADVKWHTDDVMALLRAGCQG
jgi:hypothetical protein